VDVLARSLTDGGIDGLLARCDGYADRLYAYACFLLVDEHDAASAVHDAFLVAVERAPSLREPAQLGPWLYALTRNECLRRRPSPTASGHQRELTELAVRHRLAAAEIAAVLGVEAQDAAAPAPSEPAEPPEPLPVPVAPASLRDRLAEAVPDSAVAQRAALARRAGPFRADGFPQPLDRRRLSGRVLTVSIAAVVLGTLALLIAVPTVRRGGFGAAATGLTAGGMPGRPAAEPSSWPAPRPAPATALRPPSAPAAVSTPAAPQPSAEVAGPDRTAATDRTSSGAVLLGWVENRSAPNCPRRWTARVHVQVDGIDPSEVVVTWFTGDQVQTVPLRRHDGEWIGDLGGIPAGEQLWWRARASTADGAFASLQPQPLAYTCRR
jgi:DNA-directed RNA polymerase specialized sigma24 family protein